MKKTMKIRDRVLSRITLLLGVFTQLRSGAALKGQIEVVKSY